MSNVCSTLTVEIEPHCRAKIASKKLNLLSPPKVLVNFRPHNNYDGEFGFDWTRMGDTSRPGDVWYNDIIGSYDATGTNFIQDTTEYTKLIQQYGLLSHPTKKNDFYVIPTLALLPNKKAKFSLKVEVEREAKKIEFKYDENFFKLNQTEVSHKTKGNKTLPDYLEIECIKEFSTDLYIEVLADGMFAGKLQVLANDKAHRYQADIAIVHVWTDINSTGTPNIPVLAGREDELRKYLAQCLSKPSIETLSLNLSTDAIFNSNFSSAGVITNGASDAIQDHLNTALYAQYDSSKDYRNHYKIYFISENAGGLYGRSYGIPSTPRSVVVYAIGFNDSTLVHEVLHAMGLYHSFDNNGDFTFEENKTDNIMDYSDIATPPIPVISTWQWQWKELWRNLNKE